MSPTPILAAGGSKPDRALRRRVAKLLEAGELVGLPTETVYGIAARADSPDALERLREVKGRDAEAGLTWHVASRAALDRFEHLRPLAQRLAKRYWPGPLTLVLAGTPPGLELAAQDDWTGVRLPAHDTARGLIEPLRFPVVLSSANRSGAQPLVNAKDVAEEFGAALALVVDGGSSRLSEASGVLRLGPGRFELLREGLLPIEDLRKVAGLRIAFVCTGNTCRSPMAEGLARRLLADRLSVEPSRGASSIAAFGFEVESMGVAAGSGAPASLHAVETLAARGIDIASHRSQPVQADALRDLDRVYCLTSGHRDALASLLPPSVARSIELLDPSGRDIADPIRGLRQVYEACAQEIQRALELRAEDWA